MKQETVEKAAENYTKDGNKHFMEKTNVELGFIAGAKWQQERCYSEEDMREAIVKSALSNIDNMIERCDEIIEQFKKK